METNTLVHILAFYHRVSDKKNGPSYSEVSQPSTNTQLQLPAPKANPMLPNTCYRFQSKCFKLVSVSYLDVLKKYNDFDIDPLF